jgi:allophanate hydrolase subunit 2
MRTARYTLSTTPQQVDVAADDNVAMRALAVFVQGAGNLTVCEDGDSYATGARLAVSAGQVISFDRIQGGEDVWLASSDGVAVDVVETGVA